MSDLNKLKKLAKALPAYTETIEAFLERLEAAERHIAELEAEAEKEGDITIDVMASMREWRLRAEAAEALAEFRGKHVSSLEKRAKWWKLQFERSDSFIVLFNDHKRLKAELARRDKEAGEPVAEVISVLRGLQRVTDIVWTGGIVQPVGMKLYTAATPAALPPVNNQELEITGKLSCYQAGKKAGWNECIEAAKALGVKPQKVKLPKTEYAMFGKDQLKAYAEGTILSALKSQGIEVEE